MRPADLVTGVPPLLSERVDPAEAGVLGAFDDDVAALCK